MTDAVQAQEETVTLSTPSAGVRLITLNRPDRLNALNHDLVTRLFAVLDEVEADRDCRVVVLTGAGRAFCAGLDLKGYGDDREERLGMALGTLERQRLLADLTLRLRRLRQPVIAAVNGAATGGGLALVCGSDVRIAGRSAVFAVSFIKAGYSACDLGVSWLLPRLIGAGAAHELMLTGRTFAADEARSNGLLAQVVPDDDLLTAALESAELILANAPGSVELTKQGMWLALETPALQTMIELENRQQVITALTDDCAEAQAAFLGKRTPEFTGR